MAGLAVMIVMIIMNTMIAMMHLSAMFVMIDWHLRRLLMLPPFHFYALFRVHMNS